MKKIVKVLLPMLILGCSFFLVACNNNPSEPLGTRTILVSAYERTQTKGSWLSYNYWLLAQSPVCF